MLMSAMRQTLIQAVRYALFSSSAALIEFSVATALNWIFPHVLDTPAPYWPCYLTALIISVIWNFTINRNFNFKSVVDIRVGMAKVLIYYIFFTPLSTWWTYRLVDVAGWNSTAVLVGTIVVNGVTEFLVYRFWVFDKTINTNQRAQRQAQA